MSPAPTKTHEALAAPLREIQATTLTIDTFAMHPHLQSGLPGLLQDLITATQQLVEIAAQVDPDIIHALERGVRSTKDLYREQTEAVTRYLSYGEAGALEQADPV